MVAEGGLVAVFHPFLDMFGVIMMVTLAPMAIQGSVRSAVRRRVCDYAVGSVYGWKRGPLNIDHQ